MEVLYSLNFSLGIFECRNVQLEVNSNSYKEQKEQFNSYLKKGMKAEERIKIFHGGPFVSFPRLEGTPTTQAVEEGVKRVLLSFASA